MTINVLPVLHRLNLKDQLVTTSIQYAVISLCKKYGMHPLQFFGVTDFIQPTKERSN